MSNKHYNNPSWGYHCERCRVPVGNYYAVPNSKDSDIVAVCEDCVTEDEIKAVR